MAIPSGSGTEVLKRATFSNLATGSSQAEKTFIDGTANHIYTVISIIACSKQNSSANFGIEVWSGGTTECGIVTSFSLAAYATYVWNDKFVISGTDELRLAWAGTDLDVSVSYIDQDWT